MPSGTSGTEKMPFLGGAKHKNFADGGGMFE